MPTSQAPNHEVAKQLSTYCLMSLLQSALRGGALKTIQEHDIVLNGPLQLVASNFATIGRIPIFIQQSTLNETFGTNLSCKLSA